MGAAGCQYNSPTGHGPAETRMEDILGDYRSFFDELRRCLQDHGIDIDGRRLSHLAFRTAAVEEYRAVQDRLKPRCVSHVENAWNGRPIDKLLLAEPLSLGNGFEVSLIELIPPPHREAWPMGLEHLGVVIGPELEEFVKRHEAVLTGRQDQGPWCQPAYVTFANGLTVKFYRWSLKAVVEKEGRRFQAL